MRLADFDLHCSGKFWISERSDSKLHCSLGGLPSFRSPVVFPNCWYPCFRNFGSAIPVDVTEGNNFRRVICYLMKMYNRCQYHTVQYCKRLFSVNWFPVDFFAISDRWLNKTRKTRAWDENGEREREIKLILRIKREVLEHSRFFCLISDNTLFIHARSTSNKNSLKHVRETKNVKKKEII